MERERIATDFNSVILDFARNLADVCPESLIASNIDYVEKIMRRLRPDDKEKFIGIFVANILQYKDKIFEGEEDFFLKKSFKEDLEGENFLLDNIFEFKGIWHSLKPENKELVRYYMQLLCVLGQDYFDLIYC